MLSLRAPFNPRPQAHQLVVGGSAWWAVPCFGSLVPPYELAAASGPETALSTIRPTASS